MKTPVQVAVLTISLFIAVTSCRRAPVITPTPQPQILGKWTMSTSSTNAVYTTNPGANRKDTTKFTPADYFNFKADSTVDILEGGIPHNGKWKLTNNKVYFINTGYVDYATNGWDVITLTSGKLQLGFSLSITPGSTIDFRLDFTR